MRDSRWAFRAALLVAALVTMVCGDITAPAQQGGVEPVGMRKLTEQSFDCPSTATCDTTWSVKENVKGSLTVVGDSSAPKSPPGVGRITFHKGFVGGDGLARSCHIFADSEPTNTVYISTWIQLSAKFEGHPNSFLNKMLYVYTNGRATDIAIEAQGGKHDPLRPFLVFQRLARPYPDTYGKSDATVGRAQNTAGSAVIERGAWTHYEYVLVANTPGLADGSVEGWQNGVKTFDLRNITFTPAGAKSRWEEVCWDPIWGGIGGVVSETFYMQMDHIYISGK